jgi:hypothetical protein
VILPVATGFAQPEYRVGALPAVNLNVKLKKNWSINSRIESRQQFESGIHRVESIREYDYLLTDVSLQVARKVGLNGRVGGGYLLRFGSGELAHRFIQQYAFVQKKSGYRLAHRVMTDQTISNLEDLELRFRYRLTLEVPFNGEAVDPGEFYFKVSNEFVNSLQTNIYDLENRFVPLIGYETRKKFKIETGLDYRVDGFFNQSTRHSYWYSLNFFFEI